MRSAMIALHLLAACIWIGGMFFAHFALRPSLSVLPGPSERLPLMAATLGRFFRWVSLAIVCLWASGAMLLREVPPNLWMATWHAMMGIAGVMTAIFVVIYLRWNTSLQAAVSRQDWPKAMASLGLIRKGVGVNLLLGVITLVIGSWAG